MVMKKLVFMTAIMLSSVWVKAQTVQLPAPIKTGGIPVMDALSRRHSTRDFDTTRTLSKQTLSNLLWAAWGFNRADKRTAPSSMDKQEIDIYVVTKEGISLYDAKNNVLKQVTSGDYRKDAGVQAYVATAPVNLIYVCNKSRMGENDGNIGLRETTFANTGLIAENVYLFCASENLGVVVRSSIKREDMAKIMHLTDDQIITLVQTIGYPAK